ncbi:MAG: hypothetical protein WBA28_04805, partial [Microbacteriaceae bacterium]
MTFPEQRTAKTGISRRELREQERLRQEQEQNLRESQYRAVSETEDAAPAAIVEAATGEVTPSASAEALLPESSSVPLGGTAQTEPPLGFSLFSSTQRPSVPSQYSAAQFNAETQPRRSSYVPVDETEVEAIEEDPLAQFMPPRFEDTDPGSAASVQTASIEEPLLNVAEPLAEEAIVPGSVYSQAPNSEASPSLSSAAPTLSRR